PRRNAHECGLPGTVVSDKCHEHSGFDREVDVVECDQVVECFGDACEFECGLRAHRADRFVTTNKVPSAASATNAATFSAALCGLAAASAYTTTGTRPAMANAGDSPWRSTSSGP